jgi:hypothetical protein
MNSLRISGVRFWSLGLAIIIPVIEILIETLFESGQDTIEIRRTVVALVGIALLIHAWNMQRRDVNSTWRLTFWTMLLTLLALGFLWLGLNTSRGNTYPADFSADNWWFWHVCEWQDWIFSGAKVLAAVLAVWIVVDLVRGSFHYWTGRPKKIRSRA